MFPILFDQQFVVPYRTLRFSVLTVRELRRLLFVALDGVLGSDIGAVGKVRFDMTNGVFTVGDSL
jgi:hypothetical protein